MCKQVRSSGSESAEWLHYVLAFSAFALIALALASGKIKTRQAAIEQQFHGIQQMQQSGGANSERPLKSPDEIPARITLRPLMLILGVVLGLAWLGLIVRKVRRRNVTRLTNDEREPGHDPYSSKERLNSRNMDQPIKAKTFGILEPELYFHKNASISFDVLDHDPNADFNVMLQMEPPAILDITQAIIDHQNVFDLILAWNEDVLEKCENSVFLPFGGCWIDEHDQAIHTKTKLLSVIASEKKDTKGHKLRHKIIAIDKALDSRDVYGRGYSPIGKKITALKDYMFSVIIENSTPKNYFTEKTIDCLATGTVPVFWGCENIGKFFDERGFLFFKSAREYKKMRPTLTAETYNQMLPYIKKNFELSMKYTNYLARVEAEINKSIQS